MYDYYIIDIHDCETLNHTSYLIFATLNALIRRTAKINAT